MTTKAQIAQLISSTEVAFNAGGEAGVVVGSTATIFRDTDVSDPATGEVLGVVRRPSLQFRITEVEPKFSVGVTVGTVRRPDAQSSIFGSMLTDPPAQIRVTLDNKARDYRTRVVQIGQYVEISPPEPPSPE
jgi:hypothetical protein